MDPTLLYEGTGIASHIDASNYLKEYDHLLKWRNYKENVIDIGCGEGFVTCEVLYPHIENRIASLEAVDFARVRIEFARNNKKWDKVNFKVMDIGKDDGIEEMKNKYDRVFSFYCIHWILDQRALIERLYKILKPGGQMFITSIVNCPVSHAFRKLMEDPMWSKYLQNTGGFFVEYGDDPKQYMNTLAKQIGLDVDLCETEHKTIIHNLKGFATALIEVHPNLQCIPKELQHRFIQEYLEYCDEVATKLGDSDDYNVPYESLILIVSKKV